MILRRYLEWWYGPTRLQRVLAALDKVEYRTVNEIAKEVRLSSYTTWTHLWDLEDDGLIVSQWEDGPYPRNRVYRRLYD